MPWDYEWYQVIKTGHLWHKKVAAACWCIREIVQVVISCDIIYLLWFIEVTPPQTGILVICRYPNTWIGTWKQCSNPQGSQLSQEKFDASVLLEIPKEAKLYRWAWPDFHLFQRAKFLWGSASNCFITPDSSIRWSQTLSLHCSRFS